MPSYPIQTIWTLTDAKAGNEVHARGIARQIATQLDGVTVEAKHVTPPAPWRWLAPHGTAHKPQVYGIAPPWPDVLLASSRQSIPYALHIKRASCGRVFTAILKNPRKNPKLFDFIWTPQHDQFSGDNVVTTLTSPVNFSAEDIAAAAPVLQKRLVGLGMPHDTPIIGVLIGGSSRAYKFTPTHMRTLAMQLKKLTALGYSLAMTISRRTSPDLVHILTDILADTPHFLWDGAGTNPYRGILGLARALIVTGDSVNMVGEACVAGVPVFVYHLTGGNKRFARFHIAMQENGLTQVFTPEEVNMAVKSGRTQKPVDSTADISRALLSRLAQYTIANDAKKR